jgi:hypothetical protein
MTSKKPTKMTAEMLKNALDEEWRERMRAATDDLRAVFKKHEMSLIPELHFTGTQLRAGLVWQDDRKE